MKLLLKLITVPIVLVLTLLVAMLKFLFVVCSLLLTIVSVVMAILGIGLIIISSPLGGAIYLVIAFLLSPYGLQAIAGSVIGVMDNLKDSLYRFLTS